MNILVLVLDSLRQDHVSVYHQGRSPFPDVPACKTPNLDAFAAQSIVFNNAYPESLPTIPARYFLMTGQRALPFRPWQPLRLYRRRARRRAGIQGKYELASSGIEEPVLGGE